MRNKIAASAPDNRSSIQWQSTGQRGSGSTQSDRTVFDGSHSYNPMNGLTDYRQLGCSSNDSRNMGNNTLVNNFEQSEANVHSSLSTEYRSQYLQIGYPDSTRVAQSVYAQVDDSAFTPDATLARTPGQYSSGFQRATVPNVIRSTSQLASGELIRSSVLNAMSAYPRKTTYRLSASGSPSSETLSPAYTSHAKSANGGRTSRLQANQKRSRQKRADAVQDLRRLVCPNDQSSEAEIFSKASEIIRQDRVIRLQLQEILRNAGMFMEDQEISTTDILSAIHSLAKHE